MGTVFIWNLRTETKLRFTNTCKTKFHSEKKEENLQKYRKN